MKKIIMFVLLANVSLANNTLFSGLKYPSIASAISRLETGNNTSKLYKKYNNLFGFKINKRKIYIGHTKSKYCIYANKMDSVRDYSLWEASVIRRYKITSQNQFIYHLVRRYAKDVNYKKKLLKMIKNERY